MHEYQSHSSLPTYTSRLNIPETQALYNRAQINLYNDMKTSHADWTMIRHAHTKRILSIAISHCGTFAVFGMKNLIQILNIPKNQLEQYRKTYYPLKSLNLSKNGQFLLCGYPKFLEILNFEQRTFNLKIPTSSNMSFKAIFTADGKFLAYPENNSIVFWSFSTKSEEFRLNGHEEAVLSIDCSNDNRFIISGSLDKSIIIWNFESRRQEFKLLCNEQLVKTVKISNNGKYAAGILNSTLTVWNLDLRSEEVSLKFKNKVYSVSFSPDNQTLAISGAEKCIKLFNIKKNKLKIYTYQEFIGRKIEFSPDSKILIGDEMMLWKISKPKQIIYFNNIDADNDKVLITDNGKYVGLSSDYQGLKIFNVEENRIEVIFSENKEKVIYLQLSEDSHYLLTLGGTNLRVFDLKTNDIIFHTIYIRKMFQKFPILKDFSLIAFLTSDTCFSVWNIMKNFKVFDVERGNIDILLASFSNDSRYIAFGFADYHIGVWNIDGKCEEYSLMPIMRNIRGIYFTKDQQSIITVGLSKNYQKVAYIWKIVFRTVEFTIDDYNYIWIDEDYIITNKFGKLIFWNIKGKFKEFISRLEIIPEKILYNGKRLSLFYKNYCDIWKIQEYLKNLKIKNSKLYVPINFSKNKKLAVSGDEKILKLWDIDQGKEILSFKAHKNWIRTLSFSHDNQFILSGDDDGCVKIWDLHGNQIQCFKGHLSWIVAAAFSRDDKFIVSGSNDRLVLLWQVGRNEELKAFEVFELSIQSLSFTSNGKFIAVGSNEENIRVLKV